VSALPPSIARALAWFILAGCIVGGSVIAAKGQATNTARTAATSAQVATRTLIARQCDRNQVNRAWQRVRAKAAPALHDPTKSIKYADRYFPVVDCDATYSVRNTRGATIYLPPALDHCFVRLTTEGYWTDAVQSERPPITDPRRLKRIC
jgi:hypothetical protein